MVDYSDIDLVEERFWEWRRDGREMQTLFMDLEMYLRSLRMFATPQICQQLHDRVVAKQAWDIEQGGRAPTPKPDPKPEPPKGGLRAYGW